MSDKADIREAFWRELGRQLRDRVVLLDALKSAAHSTDDADLTQAVGRVIDAMVNGRTLSQALADQPAWFDEHTIAAAHKAEQDGMLDAAADAIAARQSAHAAPGDRAALHTDGLEQRVLERIRALLSEAVNARASDVHLDPRPDGSAIVRLRVDGVLREHTQVPTDAWPCLVAGVKTMAAMDLAERALPQDGRLMIEVAGESVDCRVSVVPTVNGERMVVRVLHRLAELPPLDGMGLAEVEVDRLRELANLPAGMVIVNGPAGSGKTTILYAMLREIDRGSCCVMSVEDPVEFRIEGMAQTQIRPQDGWTFPRAIRHLLRQDPDVMMIGELRDLETIQRAAQVAMTGHLVMTTLHAETGLAAMQRLVDIGLKPFMVAATLRGVVTSRLVRRLCPQCRTPAEPKPHTLPPAVRQAVAERDATFFEAVGCEACQQQGYRGRAAMLEILCPDDGLMERLSAGASREQLQRQAEASPMRTMLQSGLELAKAGTTSLSEVVRLLPQALVG